MSDKIIEGLRFHNTDRGIIPAAQSRNEIRDQAHNPIERAIAKRRRLGTIAKTAAAVTLTVGALMGIKEVQSAMQNHDITPTGVGVGEFILRDEAKLLTLNLGHGETTEVSWDQVTSADGVPFGNYKNMILKFPPVKEVPKPGNPYHAYAILNDVLVNGRETDLAVEYADPNLGHKLNNGFSDIGSFQITPDGKYQATYKGNPIDSDQIGVIIPGEPKK